MRSCTEGKCNTMKHINAAHIAVEADARYNIRHVAETYAINTMSV